MNAIRTILFPTDLSGKSGDVFELACSIVRDRGARLIALHVVPEQPLLAPLKPLAREQVRHTEEDLRSYRHEMTKKLDSLQAPAKGVAVEHLLKEGDPATVIRQTAQELNCDLIVMETHGRSEEERHILGSVVAEVVRRPPCPVLMLRFPAE
jgi:nucleotide-binding universal stress UspA family protein